MALKTMPEHPLFRVRPVSPFLEMGAYEALWSKRGTTFKSLSERFARHPAAFRRTSSRKARRATVRCWSSDNLTQPKSRGVGAGPWRG